MPHLIYVWYGRGVDEIQFLRAANPYRLWLCEKFQVNLTLSNGHMICLNILPTSEGKIGLDVNSTFVHKHFRDTILGDSGLSIAPEYVDNYITNCQQVADMLKAHVGLLERSLALHKSVSNLLLDALETEDNDNAKIAWTMLSKSLMDYEPNSSRVWYRWLDSTRQMVKFEID